jgi:uncharacterized protein YaaQ
MELPTTSEIFKKHFGETCAVGLNHPNIENFFEELNEVCKKEDELKNNETSCNQTSSSY